MRYLIPLIFLSSSLVSLSCAASQAGAAATDKITASPCQSASYSADKWYRDSAERNAIYREIFLAAQTAVEQQFIAQKLKPRQWGVILDIDETILDGSLWNYKRDIQGDKTSWSAYAAQSQATLVPGAKTFIERIHNMGGTINLVTNRAASLQSATLKNLKQQGIYFDQILLDSSNKGTAYVDKNARFSAVIEGKAPSILPPQKILAWLGDNIQDFPGIHQAQLLKQNPEGKAYQDFGTRFFVLPNPLYGSWEGNRFEK